MNEILRLTLLGFFLLVCGAGFMVTASNGKFIPEVILLG